MFNFYNNHKRILSILLCVIMVFTVVGTSYIQAHAFVFVPILLGGVVITAAVLATLAYANALGWRTANPADSPAFGNALYDSFDDAHKAVMVAVGLGVAVSGHIIKISDEFAAYIHAKSAEFFNSSNNTFFAASASQAIPMTQGLVLPNFVSNFVDSANVSHVVINFLYNGVFSHSISFPKYLWASGVIKLTLGSTPEGSLTPHSYIEFHNDDDSRFYYIGSSPLGTFPTGWTLSYTSLSTSIPLDTTLDNRRSAVPPLPMELPSVAENGTTSIPYDPPYVDTLPTDVVADIPVDVPISLTDALTVPETIVPDATTGNADLDMVKLPLTLKDKFPFCIPFDFMTGIGMLRGNPVAPVFDFPFIFPSLGINQHFIIDLSMFDSLAAVLRWFLSLLFTILLIVATRKFIL